MISRKWLAYILIAMIAMQSVIVVAADDHQPHQDDSQHQEVVGQDLDSPSKQITKNDPKTPQGGEFDCHHCGHCHSPTQLEYISNNNKLNLAAANGLADDYMFNYISKLFTPALRPPIV